jgi:NAD(P)-dependent dehydrogenase (short-subunit alcohol dehydrogenase family)
MKLHGRIAVVTGASRGVGKGIGVGLGEAGATVYVTAMVVAELAVEYGFTDIDGSQPKSLRAKKG